MLIQTTPAPAEKLGFDLTERQREIFALVIEGLNNAEIAERPDQHVDKKRHVSSILAILQVSSRTEAVGTAYQNNLVK